MKFSSTKIKKYSGLIGKHLNNLHITCDDLGYIETHELEEAVEEIEGFRYCLDEIELKMKSHHNYNNSVIENNEEVKREETKIILY